MSQGSRHGRIDGESYFAKMKTLAAMAQMIAGHPVEELVEITVLKEDTSARRRKRQVVKITGWTVTTENASQGKWSAA